VLSRHLDPQRVAVRHHVGMPRRQVPRRVEDRTRRVRDLLRAEIIDNTFSEGILPAEEALQASFGVPRAVVRDALDRLQDEGVVRRVRGQGTFVTDDHVRFSLEEAHGVADPADDSLFNGRMNTKILDWSDTPATPPIARMLQIDVGIPVLRIDYVARVGDVAFGIATNYLTYPEATGLDPDMMRVDFYELLHRGGVEVGESTFLFDASVADEYDAALLDVEPDSPIIGLEQMIHAPDGHPIDAALCRISPRSMYFSRASRTTA